MRKRFRRLASIQQVARSHLGKVSAYEVIDKGTSPATVGVYVTGRPLKCRRFRKLESLGDPLESWRLS